MSEYECRIGVGWGVRGPIASGIRSRARQFGLTLEPFPFVKNGFGVSALEVKVAGSPNAVEQFAAWMRDRGYDDRPAPAHW